MNQSARNSLLKSPSYNKKPTRSKKRKKSYLIYYSTRFICIGLLIVSVAILLQKLLFTLPTHAFTEESLPPLKSSERSSPLEDFNYPSSLIELAQNKPETVSFVKTYPDYLNGLLPSGPISIIEDYTPGEIPLFLQWDTRWGYEYYGNDFIAINGCGPTALSMVSVGLTGNTDLNPKTIADFSYASGYLVEDTGSSWELMTQGAKELGLTSEELPLDASLIIDRLSNGHPIIASMGPGDFTTSGHFIVLAGISSDGKIIVNDSDSLIRSHKTWELDTLIKQIKNLWAFSA